MNKVNSIENKRNFVVLDGLRGVAAFAVILQHITPEFFPFHIMAGGYLAVDVFFCLSGFVLAHAYLDTLKSNGSVREYMIKRIIRIYPLYILSSLLGLIVVILGVLKGWAPSIRILESVFNVFLIPFYYGQGVNSHSIGLNFPAWSLLIELVMSIIFGVFSKFFRNIFSLTVIVLFSASFLIICTIIFGNANLGPHFADLFGGLARVLLSFSMGVMLYYLYRKLDRFSTFELPNLFSYVISAALILIFCFDAGGAAGVTYDLISIILLFPLLIFSGACTRGDGVSAKVMSILGRLSYAFYVLQIPIKDAILLIKSHLNHFSPSILTIAYILIVLISAFLLEKYYDVPIRNLLTLWIFKNSRRAIRT